MRPPPLKDDRGAGMAKRLLAVLAAIAVLMQLSSVPASAHAVLLGTVPGDGEQLDSPPGAVVLRFNEAVTPIPKANTVLDHGGKRVDTGKVTTDASGKEVTVGLGSLANGSYLVNWGVVSADGHSVRGAYVFSVGEALDPGVADVVAQIGPGHSGQVAAAARALGYLAALLTIGMVVFGLVAGTDWKAARTWVAGLGGVVVATSLLVVAAETLRLVNGDWGALDSRDTWRLAWDARHLPGAIWTAAGGLVIAGSQIWSQRRGRQLGGLTGGALIALGLAWTGHPAATSPQWFGIAVDYVHVAAVGTWFGGLVALAIAQYGEPGEGRWRLARRFSVLATITFPVAVATGLILAWRVLPGWQELTDTTYGRLLIVKVSVVLLAGIAALANRQYVVPRLAREGVRAQTLLTRLLVVEVVALLVVIGVTASLTGRSPEGESQVPIGSPFVRDQFLGPYHVVVSLEPGRAGRNTLGVDFHGFSEGGETPPVAVNASFETTDGKAGPLTSELTLVDGPHWEGRIDLPLTGTWEMTLKVRVTEFDEEKLEFRIPIGR